MDFKLGSFYYIYEKIGDILDDKISLKCVKKRSQDFQKNQVFF